jgi:SAM-dependent methyltransferase
MMRALIKEFLRPGVRRARAIWQRAYELSLRGNAVHCEACDWHGRRFAQTQCPRCSSFARHRLLVRSLAHFGLETRGRTVLHVGPNELEIAGVNAYGAPRLYARTDLRNRPGVTFVADGSQLPLPNGTFDLALIWHVLEHIPDDRAVIRELFRVLRPGGSLLVSVPIHPPGRVTTHEDPSVPRSDLERVFGFADHVRSCGLDYAERFAEAGFEVRAFEISELARTEEGAREIARYGLSVSHVSWACRRPPVRAL